MSSPFDDAMRAGYKPDEIVKFLINNMPGIGDRIKQALSIGYTADEVLQFLNQTSKNLGAKKRVSLREEQINRPFTDEPGRLVETQRQEKASKKAKRQNILTQTLDPKHLLSTAAGATIGYATGGPMGAVSSAVGGSAAYDDLVRKYEEQIASGSDITFYDFVRNLAQAAAKGTAVGFSLNQLNSILKNLSKKEEEPLNKETIDPEKNLIEGDVEVIEPESQEVKQPEVQEEIIEPEIEEVDPKKDTQGSYEIFKKMGISNIIDGISNQVEGFGEYKAIRTLYGNQFIKDLERQYKRPAEEIINEAFEYSRQKKQEQNQGLDKAQVVEQEKLPQTQVEEQKKPNYNIDPYEGEEFTSIFKSVVPSKEYKGSIQKDIKPLENSLKSSNVVGAFYDESTKKLRTLFRKGEAYEYDNISLKELENVTGGKAKPITEGSTQYGFWFPDKKKSVGAAFSKFIKKKSEEFPYRKLDPSELNKNESQLRESEKTFIASSLFEPFKKQQKKGQQKEKGIQLRLMEPALKEADDEFLQEIVEFIEDKLNLKSPIKMTRLQKEFKKEFL